MTNTEVAQAIYLATKDKKGAELAEALSGATKFLARKRLLSKSNQILQSLEKIIHKAEGKMVVHIKSPTKVKEETKKEITQLLKKHYTAKEFIFTESIDETLLGGVRIELENEVIDLSLKNKIGQLEEHLNRA